jgi:hypothetical protein
MKSSLLICFLVVFAIQGANAAPVEWPVSEGGNGHYYQARRPGGRWIIVLEIASQLTYAGMQGHLATLTSAEEDAWVFENVLGPQGIRGTDYHLGGWAAHMYGNPGGLDGWQWLTGQPWDFENWAPGEPNNAGGEGDREKCLAYHYFYRYGGESLVGWNDVSDDSHYRYIVEFDDEDASNHPPYTPVTAEASTWGGVKALFR